jgi:hypothetical protein
MRNLLLQFRAKVLLAALILISLYSSAQNEPWQEKMADPSVNIYEVKQSFEQAWLNKPIIKGKGYKQFKRWEYFMDARCFPTGVRFAPDAVAVAMDQQPEMFAFNSQMPGSWTYIGNTSVPTGGGGAGRVNSVRPLPGSTTTFFACAPAGGLWKTTNSGVSWSLMNTDGLASIGVSDVAIDPNNTNIMYIATGDGDAGDTYALGVLKTTDGGLTWNTTGLSWSVTNNRTTSRLLIDPSDSQKVIAATSNGIYRTTNGGTSWTQVQTGSFKDLDFHPSNPLIVYATGASYFRSADGGATWTNITSGLPTTDVTRMALAVSANNSSYVYILAGKSSDAGMRGVYRSTDAGLTFTAQYTGPLNLMGWDPAGTDAGGQAWYDLVIEADPNNANIIYTGGVNVWKSSNGGTSWALAGHWYGGGGAPYVHADIHAMAFVPGTTRLLVGCDGGVFTTTNGGPNFSDISSNLQIAQQYRLSVSQTNANLVLSGWQDNGTNLKNGSTWTRPIGGDGMECIINPSNSSIMYGELYYGDIRKSTNGGVSFSTQVCSSGGTGVNENGAWVTPYVLGSNPAHLYVGKTRVYKSIDNGATFTSLAAFGTGVINALCVAPANNNYIYASKGGTMYRSIDNGATFSTVTGLPGNYITYICTNSSNAQEVYVTVSGFNSGVKVYKSTNAGTSWTNISGALPNIPANCIVYQTGSASNALYVGTDAGVYYRDDVIGNWVPYMNGMPNVVVDELEIQYNTNTIVAATYGRGTWSAPLYALPQRDVTIASITSPSGTTCESLIAPSFEILNAGQNTVTSVTFSYQVNTNTALTYTWTGSLASGGTAAVTPPTYDYGNGAFTLTVNITSVNGLGADENTGNNSSVVSYYVSGGTNTVTLNLLTDCYPEETSWSVTQGGVTIFQGAGYAGATNNSITMCLDDGCFVLNIFDSYGDGLSSCATGDFELINNANGAILATMAAANFGFQSTNNFCLNLPTPGCTNPTACNYNAAATTDDGSCVFGPANDICVNATSYTINGGAVTAINTGTCNNAANPTCGGATAIKDIWYKFVYTGGDITIQTSAGSSAGVAALTDTRMAVYTSCGGTLIVCNDDISSTNYYSSIVLTCAQLTVGNTYYVQLGGYNGLEGVCSFNITKAEVLGCTNPLATNYNVCATVDNGTCTGLIVPGCTNVTACNYNSAANEDDGSCILPTTYYRDLDNDTYGNAAQTIQACSLPAGYVTNSTDCNDNNAAVRPGATEVCNSIDDDCDTSIDEGVQLTFYRDLDGDTYGNAAQTIQACSAPAGYVSNSTDCNDNNAAVRPGATEVCNSIDDDCDTSIDEGVQLTFYRDLDGDTYGNAAQTIQACSTPAGYVSNSTDCNDNNAAVRPGATEVCNSIDDDCDTSIDEGVQLTFYRDLDGDTYGNAAQTIQACSAPAGYVSNSTDCNDNNAAVRPGATEVCNSIDDDCDASIDEGVQSTFYRDLDGDTYGNAAQTIQACSAPAGYVSNSTDCNDSSSSVYPGASEVCGNGIDDDCANGDLVCPIPGCMNATACNYNAAATVDNGTCTFAVTYYLDADADGFAVSTTSSCSNPGAGYTTTVLPLTDCNDASFAVKPSATELCSNTIDDDCDGLINEGCTINYAANDNQANATVVVPANYPSCTNRTGNLALASAEDGGNADLWYTFTATTNAIRISVTGTTATNTDIQVLDNFGNQIGSIEDASSANGNEIFMSDDLVIGQVYDIAVGNAGGFAGTFTVCIQALRPSGCGNGPTFEKLCNTFKATWTGTTSYTVVLQSVSNPGNFYVQTTANSAQMPFTGFTPLPGNTLSGGVQYGQSYSASVSANYTLTDAGGNVEVYVAQPAQSTCVISINAQPAVNLGAAFVSSAFGVNTRSLNTNVSTDISVCGIQNYTWEFVAVDPLTNQIITSELPRYWTGATTTRNLKLSNANISGIAAGKRYRVRVRPNFAYGNGSFDLNSTLYLQITGSAGMTVNDGEVDHTVLLQERNEEVMSIEDFGSMLIYPNPSNGSFINLNLEGIDESNIMIDIIDSQGRKVYSQSNVITTDGFVRIEFENQLAAGLYTVLVSMSNEILTEKVVVKN